MDLTELLYRMQQNLYAYIINRIFSFDTPSFFWLVMVNSLGKLITHRPDSACVLYTL